MDFYEHFERCGAMDKEHVCPDRCELKDFSAVPPIWVPPPQKRDHFVGVVVSRDPTTEFIPVYSAAKIMGASSGRAHLFHSNAIPRWIFDRIAVFNRMFMQNTLSEKELTNFRDVLFEGVYWTHLHKCCTDKRGEKSLSFKRTNAHQCADRWLRSEIEHLSREGIEFIIMLGKDVELWFESNQDQLILPSTIRLYHLPHPSRANMASWYPKDERVRDKLAGKIVDLVTQCNRGRNDS
jgi:hypothetical protein